MVKHAKHEDNLDVQVRTKILDEYGNPIEGAIEYDPSTGIGKRIKDPTLGLVEGFFRKGGSIEIDGHSFDEDNHDPAVVDGIRDMINLRVNRNTPEYEDLLRQHIEQRKADDRKAHPPGPHKDKPTPPNPNELTFTAVTQIARGEEVKVDMDKLEVRGTRSENVFHPQQEDADRHKAHTNI